VRFLPRSPSLKSTRFKMRQKSSWRLHGREWPLGRLKRLVETASRQIPRIRYTAGKKLWRASILHPCAASSTREKGESAESHAAQRPGRWLRRRLQAAQSEVSDLTWVANESAAIGIIERLRRSPSRCAAGNRECSIRENPILRSGLQSGGEAKYIDPARVAAR